MEKHSSKPSSGRITAFEADAKWQLKCQINTAVPYCWLLIILALVFLTMGFVVIWVQCSLLATAQQEMNSNLQELKQLKQALQECDYICSDLPHIGRFKRNLSGRGKSFTDKKSFKYLESKRKGSRKKHKSSHTAVLSNKQAFAVHLERNISYTETGTNGIISYWNPQNWANSNDTFEKVTLENRGSSIVIPSTGLYLIYAQLCYAVTREFNSFEVRVMSGDRTYSESKVIAQCIAGTSEPGNEITCFTSVVQVLRADDRVYLQQTQKNRQLLMNMGRSFMGVIKL